MDAMMKQAEAVYGYPIWAVGLTMALVAVGAALALNLIVSRFVRVGVRVDHNVLTSSVASTIGVTYAVLLAFMAMLAWENYDSAQAATTFEAAKLFDVARTATALPDPSRAAVRSDMVAYATIVREDEWPAQAEGRIPVAGERPLDDAYAAVASLKPADIAQGNLQAALVGALTQLRDAREKRLAAAEAGIPGIVWVVVAAGGALTLVAAALLGAQEAPLHLALVALLALSGTLVLVMIVSLSHPFRGDFRVRANPFAAVAPAMAAGSGR